MQEALLYATYVRVETTNLVYAINRHEASTENAKQKRMRRMVSSRMLRRVTLVRTDVSEELRASFIRVTRIGEQRRHFFAACVGC
jgi:hypothetical protein